MIIKTLEEKQAHHFASKIPLLLWRDPFRNELDITTIPDSHKQLIDVNRGDLPENTEQACIILMLRYADTAASELLDHLSGHLAFKNLIIFNLACRLERLDILDMIKQRNQEQLQAMITANNYGAFRVASENGHFNVLNWFKEEAPGLLQAMIEANNYSAFRAACLFRHIDTCRWLLEMSNDLLGYAEPHHREGSWIASVIYPFIDEKIATLHRERDEVLAANPNSVFDITDPQIAQQYFYIMRNRIRRNEPALNNELRFLLDIPALKALAHQADNTGDNALIRLAMATDNDEASTALLAIEAVRTHAAENNFYSDEMQNGVDLAQLAADRESSMTALTPGEAKRLNKVLDRYAPLLRQAGISHIMNDLRNTLADRYHANPATIMVNNAEVKLPLDYHDFEALHLSPDDMQKAYTAYYQHDAHTALRYLSKPSPWMHPDAAYVNVHVIDDVVTERWSTFVDYQDLISLQYLAAIDKESEPTDGHTLETRLDMFIKELGLIGRAHNWDKTRVRNGKREEFDDLEADRPSCSSGVKRRLFQSVQGHALFSFLTQDIVNKVLLKQIQTHFKETFTEDHRADLAAALDCVRDGDDIPEDVFNRLSTLNITAEKIESIIRNMTDDFTDKYGPDAFLPHIAFIKDKFKLPDDNQKADKRMTHLMKFYTSADLKRVLTKETEAKPDTVGLFSGRNQNENEATSSESSKLQPQRPKT